MRFEGGGGAGIALACGAAVLAQRNELAEDFTARCKAHVGRATLVFTRYPWS